MPMKCLLALFADKLMSVRIQSESHLHARWGSAGRAVSAAPTLFHEMKKSRPKAAHRVVIWIAPTPVGPPVRACAPPPHPPRPCAACSRCKAPEGCSAHLCRPGPAERYGQQSCWVFRTSGKTVPHAAPALESGASRLCTLRNLGVPPTARACVRRSTYL